MQRVQESCETLYRAQGGERCGCKHYQVSMATRCSYMQSGVACCSFRLRVCTKVQQRLHLLPCHDTSSAIYCAATTQGGFARTASVDPRAAAANSALSPWAFSASGLAPWLSNKAMVSLWLPNAASMSGVLPDRLHLASPLALASNITSATAVCPQRHATHLCACVYSAQGHQKGRHNGHRMQTGLQGGAGAESKLTAVGRQLCVPC